MKSCIKIMQDGMQNREKVYDWVRLIATIFVVIGHSAYLKIHTAHGGVDYILPTNISPVYNSQFLVYLRFLSGWVYSFHMPLFFMLSGAVLALKPLGLFDKVVRSKIKRLLIPYFVFAWIFMLPVKWLGNFYDNKSFFAAMKGVLSGSDSGHLWFLTALFWCILIFVIIKKVLENYNTNSCYGLLLLCGLIQLSVEYVPFDILGLKKGIEYIFFFALGYVFQVERYSQNDWNMKKTMVGLIFLIALEILHRKYWIINKFFLIIIGSFLSFLSADMCNRMFPKMFEKDIFKIVIRNLFYVYIFHDPMEYIVLRFYMEHGLLASDFGCVTYTFCRIVGVFVISIFLGECVERLKSIFCNILRDRKNMNT